MTPQITQLTEAQKSRFPEWSQKWIEIGLSCEPIDMDVSAKYISECYAHAGLTPPKKFIKASSPLALAISAPMAMFFINGSNSVRASVYTSVRASVYASVSDSVRYSVVDSVSDSVVDSVRDSVVDSVSDSVYDSVVDSVSDSVFDSVRDSVVDSVRNSVYASVVDSVSDSVRASVYDSVRACVRNSVRDYVKDKWIDYVGGNLWSIYPSFESFFFEVCELDIPEKEKAASYRNANSSCGWWYPTTDFVMVCDRPQHIDIENGNVHSATRLAIQWRDGWGIAMWRGIRIPNEWITGEKPTAKELLALENIEQRRCGFELIGWNSLLTELDAVMIDSHPNPEIGDLFEIDLPDSGKERFIKVRCGTGREFVIPVVPACNTALEAQAWSYGLDDYNIQPEIRT